MKPVDYRNANWMDLRERIQGARQDVYLALAAYGPCTTRELAAASGMDVCSVRPRVTELLELGLAECAGGEQAGVADPGYKGAHREGTYRAVALPVAEETFARRCREARTGQLALF